MYSTNVVRSVHRCISTWARFRRWRCHAEAAAQVRSIAFGSCFVSCLLKTARPATASASVMRRRTSSTCFRTAENVMLSVEEVSVPSQSQHRIDCVHRWVQCSPVTGYFDDRVLWWCLSGNGNLISGQGSPGLKRESGKLCSVLISFLKVDTGNEMVTVCTGVVFI